MSFCCHRSTFDCNRKPVGVFLNERLLCHSPCMVNVISFQVITNGCRHGHVQERPFCRTHFVASFSSYVIDNNISTHFGNSNEISTIDYSGARLSHVSLHYCNEIIHPHPFSHTNTSIFPVNPITDHFGSQLLLGALHEASNSLCYLVYRHVMVFSRNLKKMAGI